MARGGKTDVEQPLNCECGNTGKAIYEEVESPIYQPGVIGFDYKRFRGVEGEFTHGDGYDPAIFCKCGKKVA